MKLEQLVRMMPDESVALKSTMNQTHTGTRVYSTSEACQRYLQLIQRDGNKKKAIQFLKDLVEFER